MERGSWSLTSLSFMLSAGITGDGVLVLSLKDSLVRELDRPYAALAEGRGHSHERDRSILQIKCQNYQRLSCDDS